MVVKGHMEGKGRAGGEKRTDGGSKDGWAEGIRMDGGLPPVTYQVPGMKCVLAE